MTHDKIYQGKIKIEQFLKTNGFDNESRIKVYLALLHDAIATYKQQPTEEEYFLSRNGPVSNIVTLKAQAAITKLIGNLEALTTNSFVLLNRVTALNKYPNAYVNGRLRRQQVAKWKASLKRIKE